MRFRYFDPLDQATVEGRVQTVEQVAELIGLVAALRASQSPAVEFTGHDGTSLVLGIAGERAVLLWTDSSGQTSHSVGADGGDGVVFDYFGSYTELPGAYAVSTQAAVSAAGDYVDSGAVPALALAAD